MPVLSRLVDEKTRPILLPAGERVKALWLALHKLCPALTASDFIIMPDHVHLLLMVDYGALGGSFSPLVFSHWFRYWSATTAGGTAPEPPVDWGRYWAAPGGQPPAFVSGAPGALPPAAAGVRGAASPPAFVAWEPRFWLDLAMGSRHLKAIRHYIRLNPARALWKQRHPDCFVLYSGIRHPILDAAHTWDGMGELTLLASPFLFHVRLTLKKTVAEHEQTIVEMLERAERGAIPVSGFISPGEVELLRRLKATPGTRFIKTVPYALPKRYDPSAEDSRELAAHRMLILSGFPQSMERSGPGFRANCLAMNDLAAALCERAHSPE